MDKLVLKGLKFHGRHGVYDQEKVTGNTFEVDLEFTLSLQKASETDDLTHTIDYAKAYSVVADILQNTSVNLIETLALRIGTQLYSEFKIESLKVSVRKINPPMGGETDYSEVTMQWPR